MQHTFMTLDHLSISEMKLVDWLYVSVFMRCLF